jgi:hypothetical protein
MKRLYPPTVGRHITERLSALHHRTYICFVEDDDEDIGTGYTQKNCAVSKVKKKIISHLTRAQLTPSAVATVQVSYALPAVRFSCLLRGRGVSF